DSRDAPRLASDRAPTALHRGLAGDIRRARRVLSRRRRASCAAAGTVPLALLGPPSGAAFGRGGAGLRRLSRPAPPRRAANGSFPVLPCWWEPAAQFWRPRSSPSWPGSPVERHLFIIVFRPHRSAAPRSTRPR